MPTVRLLGPSQRAWAHKLIDEAPAGHVMKLGAETRRDAQNRAMHGWIKAIREQDEGMRAFSPEQVKLIFLDALLSEMTFLPKLEGAGMFPAGYRSSTLTVEQFAALLTIMDEWAARHGIVLPRRED